MCSINTQNAMIKYYCFSKKYNQIIEKCNEVLGKKII